MSGQVTLEEVEQQVAQLPPHEQLKLVALISERLSLATQATSAVAGDEESLRQQREREADELLALCDTAAELWEGEFDAAEEIRQMRQERDERVWPSKS
jgi:hypothetical protein